MVGARSFCGGECSDFDDEPRLTTPTIHLFSTASVTTSLMSILSLLNTSFLRKTNTTYVYSLTTAYAETREESLRLLHPP